MLVQFMMKNVLSFKEETILDMTAVRAYKEHEYNLITNETKEKFLRVAAIYGANASGKSNLFKAMALFQWIVEQSFNNIERTEKKAIEKCYRPFLFDTDQKNSEFQIIDIYDGYEYKYGFEYNAECIVSEWMYRKSIKTNRTVTILERTKDELTLGAAVKRECEIYQDQVLPETLALSFFNRLRLDTEIFSILYDEISAILIADADFDKNSRILTKHLPEIIDNEKKQLTDFVTAIDTGIRDISYEKENGRTVFFASHVDPKGNQYVIPLSDESEGTVRCIMIFILARSAIQNDQILFMDELNVKLHPLLLKFIVDLFYDKSSAAQLIYTTHDTTLLDKRFFRRDQIWFVQKDEEGHSELTALSDFKIRSDASFEKDYLAGVYGGIPFIKEFEIREGE